MTTPRQYRTLIAILAFIVSFKAFRLWMHTSYIWEAISCVCFLAIMLIMFVAIRLDWKGWP